MHSNSGELLAVDFYLNSWLEWHVMEKIFINALTFSNMNVVDKILHKFEPQGETCVWLLEESHMAVHTYPENNYFALDIFTCGAEGKPQDTITYLKKSLPMKTFVFNKIKRGEIQSKN